LAAAYKRPRQTSDGIELPRAADGRTLASRRFRSLCDAFAAEFGGQLTEVDRGLIAQAAGLTLRAEQLQTAIVRGQDVSNDELVGNILIAAMGRRNVGLPAPDVRASGPAMRVMGMAYNARCSQTA
jgi:hypothetical protein